VTTLARLVARERDAATQRLWDSLCAALTVQQRAALDALLVVPPGGRVSELERWRTGPARPSGPQMGEREVGERDKLGEATPRAPQGPEATAARTSASCVDDDQGVAVVEIGDRHHRGAGRRSCPGARSPWFAAKASVLR